jgi:hypothetical protein
MWRRVIDCLGWPVAIDSTVSELEEPLRAVFATFAESTLAPALRYELRMEDVPTVYRDGVPWSRQECALDLVPAAEGDVYYQLALRAPHTVLLHAAAVSDRNGQAVVFAGRSGAGKSTLLRALLERGFLYLTEECVALSADGTATGLARPLHVEDDTTSLPRGFAEHDYLLRRGERWLRSRLFCPPPERVRRAPAQVRALVAIDHGPDAPDALQPLSTGRALQALWPQVMRADARALSGLTSALGSVARYQLLTRSPERALSAALQLAEDHGLELR